MRIEFCKETSLGKNLKQQAGGGEDDKRDGIGRKCLRRDGKQSRFHAVFLKQNRNGRDTGRVQRRKTETKAEKPA